MIPDTHVDGDSVQISLDFRARPAGTHAADVDVTALVSAIGADFVIT